ncbi:synaptotagmin-like protein 2 [Ambystoma mexicanum]|uniref:synaptotagmin-like protein 2 n=1 Tax=Ambystoma mexicanum TaxID=8296 RepID=UPI0037E7E6D7
MKKNNRDKMLDLSFLTEEEYEKLMQVLQRDEELKRKDGDRIRRLKGSIKDEKKKKFVTGEWFQDVKAQRFEEDLHGSDLLRASIRKKKTKTHSDTCRDGNESDDPHPGSSPPNAPSMHLLTESSTDLENDRYYESKEVDNAEIPRTLPKPKVRPPVLQSMSTSSISDKKYSLTEISPADSGIGLSPFVATDNSQQTEKGHDILLASHTKVCEKEVVQINPSPQWDLHVDTTSKKGPTEERHIFSKIPVKQKPSKVLPKPEVVLNNFGRCDASAVKTESLTNSSLSSPDAESNNILKQGSHFTVFSLKDKPKDQETIVDRDHFKTLKSFWEKGADVGTVNHANDVESVEKQNSSDSNGRHFFPLNRSISVHSDKSQEGEEKGFAELPHRTRYPFKRAVTPSSSEDEPLYIHVPHSRKGATSSSAPRSTYGRSKGPALSKNNAFAESNGRHNGNEENRSPVRHSKKSRLPVRIPSVQLDNKVDTPVPPKKERLQSLSDPEMLTVEEEVIVPESVQKRAESLQSKVQILIDAATTDDDEKDKTLDSAVNGFREQPTLEANGELTEKCDIPDPEGDEDDDSPVVMALARANSLSNARSMVNIYTTTETYNKPPTQQLLEPERVKELSRSTPALLSETESDTASEISFQFTRHRKTQSSGSHSSDMASVSSISNSVLSVYSGDFGSVDAQGMAQFALDYDEKNREFQIYIGQCCDLAVVDEKKARSDPYVKTYLLPDKARMGKRKTSVKRRTINPIYNEVLRYKIEKMVLLIQKLNLSVWHNDPLGRNSFLGEMEIDLASWDWSNRKLNWYTLKPRSLSAINGVDHRGVMNLSIKYVPPGSLGPKHPSSGEVHIWVKDTKDLLQLRPSGVDSFVKCYVLPDTSKKSYQKTRVIKKDPNPVFNHTIVYDGFHTEDLKDACVELTIWDHEKFTNHFLGGIRLGLGTGKSYGVGVDWMDSTQEEIAFWQEMMSAPGEWNEGSLPLRSLAGKRKFK